MAPPKGSRRRNGSASQHSREVAIDAVKAGNMNIREASKFYKVPKETIRRHVRGISRNFKPGPQPKFCKADEEELAQACDILAQSGHGIRTHELQLLAMDLTEEKKVESFHNGLPTAGWVQRFKKRQKCAHRKAQNVSAARMNNETVEVKNDFYTRLDAAYNELKKRGLDSSCVFNVDETGLTVVGEGGKVIARKGSKSVRQRTSAERGENITVVATINASGSVILPPTVIFKGVQIHEEYMMGAMEGVVFATSKSSFIDSELFGEFLDRFIASIPAKRPVLLLLDGHASHFPLKVIKKARDNDIHMLMFPGHTTHLFQPLDVGVFGPLTAAFRAACSKLIRKNKLKQLSRRHFSTLLTEAWREAVIPANIVGGFAGSGVRPWDPARVILPIERLMAQKELAAAASQEDPSKPTKAKESTTQNDAIPSTSSTSNDLVVKESNIQNDQRPSTSSTSNNLVAKESNIQNDERPSTSSTSNNLVAKESNIQNDERPSTSSTSTCINLTPVATVLQKFLAPVCSDKSSSSRRVTTTRMVTSNEFVKELEDKEAKKKKEEEEKLKRKEERLRKQEEKKQLLEKKKLEAAEKKTKKRVSKKAKRKRCDDEVESEIPGVDSPDSDFEYEIQSNKENKKPKRKTRKSSVIPKAVDVQNVDESEENTLCGKCKLSFLNDFRGESWISCATCKIWYHNKCLDLSENFYSPSFSCC